MVYQCFWKNIPKAERQPIDFFAVKCYNFYSLSKSAEHSCVPAVQKTKRRKRRRKALKKKKDLPWPLIIFMLAVCWPVGVFMMLAKIFGEDDDDKKKDYKILPFYIDKALLSVFSFSSFWTLLITANGKFPTIFLF